MTDFVIDSSAIMALVLGETGADKVAQAVEHSMASAVIFAECLGKLALKGGDRRAIAERLLAAGLAVEPADAETALKVSDLYGLARQNLSLADRFCLALAADRALPVLTADRAWAGLDLPVEVHLIR